MTEKITMIKAQRRSGRYNVYLNGHYAFPISENVLIKYRVAKGMPVTPELRNRLVSADRISKLYSAAVDFLAHRLRTVAEVKRKLRHRTTDEAMIDRVVAKLRALGLIDDQNYADSYVRSEVRQQNRGPVVIRQKLRLKGIRADRISRAIRQWAPVRRVVSNGVHQAKKMFKRHRRDSFRRNLQKVKAGLVRKGYPFGMVDEVIDRADLRPDRKAQQRLLADRAKLAWRRYRRRPRSARIVKTKQYLFRRGFSVDDIDRVLSALIN